MVTNYFFIISKYSNRGIQKKSFENFQLFVNFIINDIKKFFL